MILSVLIHTKNEEGNISDCIKSVKKIADEIIVCDMASIDKTTVIAKKLGARVIRVKDYGLVEPARNVAIKHAKSDWILILDADERLTSSLGKKIQEYIKKSKSAVVMIPRKNIFLGKWLQHGVRWPDYQVRLFKREAVTWQDEIHSQPIFQAEADMFPAEERYALVHYHTQTIDNLIEKSWQQAQKENFYHQQQKITPEMVRKRLENEIDWRFFENQAYRDGIPGYIQVKFMEVYRLLEFVSYWEKNQIEFSQKETLNLINQNCDTHGIDPFLKIKKVVRRLLSCFN